MDEPYVGIDLHRRHSVIVRMTGAGEVLETIRDHNDTFLVKSFQLAPAITGAGKWCDGAISFGHGR